MADPQGEINAGGLPGREGLDVTTPITDPLAGLARMLVNRMIGPKGISEGIVTGPNKPELALLAPRVFRYLNSLPQRFNVSTDASYPARGLGGTTTPVDQRGRMFDIKFNPYVTDNAQDAALALKRGAPPNWVVDDPYIKDGMRLAAHEGIHAGYMGQRPELAQDFIRSRALNIPEQLGLMLRSRVTGAGFAYPPAAHTPKMNKILDQNYFDEQLLNLARSPRPVNPYDLETAGNESIVNGMANRAASAEISRWLQNVTPPYLNMFR